jgi:pimeloyl-ACP methyl ester carboxylesterase
MTEAVINGVHFYDEVTGRGFPLVLCHEFAANCHSWDEQVRFFSRHYQVIVYNAKGYPPSDVPDNVDLYMQDAQVADLHGLLNRLDVKQAYVGGLSIGARSRSISVQCALLFSTNGMTEEALPTSLQIVYRYGDEATALRIGWAFQQALQWHQRRPTGF